MHELKKYRILKGAGMFCFICGIVILAATVQEILNEKRFDLVLRGALIGFFFVVGGSTNFFVYKRKIKTIENNMR